mmetsp:Transcript_10774/g.22923  ORF Transcript_10774/g.22923 Transcript_10774/m.22923 type:complete len:274 (+) Transcript_10774:661-1482(+)
MWARLSCSIANRIITGNTIAHATPREGNELVGSFLTPFARPSIHGRARQMNRFGTCENNDSTSSVFVITVPAESYPSENNTNGIHSADSIDVNAEKNQLTAYTGRSVRFCASAINPSSKSRNISSSHSGKSTRNLCEGRMDVASSVSSSSFDLSFCFSSPVRSSIHDRFDLGTPRPALLGEQELCIAGTAQISSLVADDVRLEPPLVGDDDDVDDHKEHSSSGTPSDSFAESSRRASKAHCAEWLLFRGSESSTTVSEHSLPEPDRFSCTDCV